MVQPPVYELFRHYRRVVLRGNFSLHWLRGTFARWLPRVIPLNVRVKYPLRSLVWSAPLHLLWTIGAWQISSDAWRPAHPLHSDFQWLHQPRFQVQAVSTCHHSAEPHAQTQRVARCQASYPTFVAHPLPSSVLTTCQLQCRIHTPARLLRTHCERLLHWTKADRGNCNCNFRRCEHLTQWSLAVTAPRDVVTQTSPILSIHRAVRLSSLSLTEVHWGVHQTWR